MTQKRSIKTYWKYLRITLMVWGGFAVAMIGVYVGLLRPQQKLQKKIHRDIEEQKQQHEEILRYSTEAGRARMQEELDALIEELSEFTIDRDKIGPLTFNIKSLATDRNLSATQLHSSGRGRAQEIEDCKHLLNDRLNITFRSGFPQFAGFISDLERNTPILFIDNFILERNNKNVAESEVEMDVCVLLRKTK